MILWYESYPQASLDLSFYGAALTHASDHKTAAL